MGLMKYGFSNISKKLVDMKSQNVYELNSIKTYDFLIIYITISHDILKTRYFK